MQTQKSRPGAGTAGNNAHPYDKPINKVLQSLESVKKAAHQYRLKQAQDLIDLLAHRKGGAK